MTWFIDIFWVGTSHHYQWQKQNFLCNKNSYHSKAGYRNREILSTVFQDLDNNENVDISANTIQRSKDSIVVDTHANVQSQRLPLHDITNSTFTSK